MLEGLPLKPVLEAKHCLLIGWLCILAGISYITSVGLVPNTTQHVVQVGSSLGVSKHRICAGQVSNGGPVRGML